MVGHAFMGAAHSQAWRNAPRFFDLAADARDGGGSAGMRRRSPPPPIGWAGSRPRPTGSALIERDDIDLVDICTPGDTHAEIAIAALEAGKHVLCEKPLANTVEEAEAMAAAAEKAAADGVRSMVGFTYRRVPAIALARRLVAEGRIGDRPPRPRAVPPGLDRRPGGPAVVAVDKTRRGPGRSATSARTSSTSPNSTPRSTRCCGRPGSCWRARRSRRAPTSDRSAAEPCVWA